MISAAVCTGEHLNWQQQECNRPVGQHQCVWTDEGWTNLNLGLLLPPWWVQSAPCPSQWWSPAPLSCSSTLFLQWLSVLDLIHRCLRVGLWPQVVVLWLHMTKVASGVQQKASHISFCCYLLCRCFQLLGEGWMPFRWAFHPFWVTFKVFYPSKVTTPFM